MILKAVLDQANRESSTLQYPLVRSTVEMKVPAGGIGPQVGTPGVEQVSCTSVAVFSGQ